MEAAEEVAVAAEAEVVLLPEPQGRQPRVLPRLPKRQQLPPLVVPVVGQMQLHLQAMLLLVVVVVARVHARGGLKALWTTTYLISS